MQNAKKRVLFSTVAGLTLCVTFTARMTSAQGPAGQGQAGYGQGPGQGGPGGGGQGRRGGGFGGPGGRGGFGGQMPFATGTITGGDANARTITIQSQFGGNPQTIQLGTTTQLVTQTTVTAADLKVGDQVQVQGVPTGITASSITAGQMPTFLQGGGRGGAGGNRPGGANNGGGPGDNSDPNDPNGGPNNGAGGAQGANSQTAFAQATGRVVSISPLTISLGNDISLTIKMASKARITKISTVDFSSLKVGDRVTVAGQAGSDGKFNATGIGVNMTMGGGMGMGGPGGFGGGRGGFGGPGGGGPGGGGRGGFGGGPGGPPNGQGGPGGPGE